MADVLHADDRTIGDSSVLWRRIHRLWAVPDDNQGAVRVSSAAFTDSSDGSPTSILLAQIVFATNRNHEEVLQGFDGYGLASLTAGQARGCKQGVQHSPEPNEPAHGFIVGNKTKAARRCLAASAMWVVRVSGGT